MVAKVVAAIVIAIATLIVVVARYVVDVDVAIGVVVDDAIVN